MAITAPNLELAGLANIVMSPHTWDSPAEHKRAHDEMRRQINRQFYTEENPIMATNGCQTNYVAFDEGELLSPKKLRKQADAIEAQRKATRKAQKAAAKRQRKAAAARAENLAVARAALIRVASDPTKGYASVEAAKALIDA